MNSFKEKVVVVTGGASGIGAAICKCFGKEGAKIAILDADTSAIDEVEKSLMSQGIEFIAFPCDITNEDLCNKTIDKVIVHYGGIDILVNNAGITQRSAFCNTDISVYRKVMDINFFGSLICTQAAIDSIIERKGTIVVTSSIAGVGPLLGRTGYCASKHALHGLFESLRTEVSHLGVHILMLCPGFTKTNLQSRALDSDGTVTKHPQSTIGKSDTPEDVANKLLKAILNKKKILVLTPSGKSGYMLSRFFPSLYERIITNKFKHELDRC